MYRNTNNKEALRLYRLGGRTFTCGVRATYIEARGYFERAADLDKDFARAKSWLAYTLAEGWSYGWFPDCDRNLAPDLAEQALGLDPGDYQNHWTMAVVLKVGGQLKKARAKFEEARQLRDDDPDLLAEMAETLVYLGEHKDAIKLMHEAMDRKLHVRAGDQVERVTHPDWYLWNFAWVNYFTRDYQVSLHTLCQMTTLPNDAYLLQAANFFQLGDIDRAKEAMQTHQDTEPEWTVSKERAVEHFQVTEDMDHWLDALQGAGLPP